MERANKNLRTSFAMVAFVLIAFALAMTATLATPAQAQAASKTKVWVVTGAKTSYSDLVDQYTFTYKNGLLTKSVDKSSYSDGSTLTKTDTWKYDNKGNYKNFTSKIKNTNGFKYTMKYKLKFDSAKRVRFYKVHYTGYDKSDPAYQMTDYSVDGISYNGKGRCKRAGDAKFTYDKKGLLKTVSVSGGWVHKITRDSKGSVTKTKTTGSRVGAYTGKNVFASGRLASWEGGFTYPMADDVTAKSGEVTWKQISVPKAKAAKVKAQQRWIVDSLQGAGGGDTYPLILVNK